MRPLCLPLFSDAPLLHLGDLTAIGAGATLRPAAVLRGQVLSLAEVTVGEGCAVGARCVLPGGSVVGDGASLDPLTVLAVRTTTTDMQQSQPP